MAYCQSLVLISGSEDILTTVCKEKTMDKLIKDFTIAIPLKSGYAMIMIGQEELTCIVVLAPRLGTPAMTPLQLSRDFEEKLSRSAYSNNQNFSSERKPVLLRELIASLLAEIMAKFRFKNDTYPDIDTLAKELLEHIKDHSA